MNYLQLGAGCLLTMLLLALGHWAPWKPGRLWAYIYGCLAILIGFAIWQYPEWQMVIGLAGIVVSGGGITLLSYAIDDYVDARRKRKMAEIEHASE